MSTELNAGEVLEIAETIEREAASYYRQAAAAATSPQAREQLMELAEMEDEHVQVFHGLRVQLSEDRPRAERAGARGMDGLPLLAALVARNMKDDLAESFAGREGPADLLRRAVDFEKDTVVFYTGVKEMLPEPSDRAKVDKIILEELRHVLTLTTGSTTPGGVH